jgi:hypothetical protein
MIASTDAMGYSGETDEKKPGAGKGSRLTVF